MRKLSITTSLLFVFFFTTFINNTLAQHLPKGAYHTIREHTADILHYKADLQLDLVKGQVSGEATITFVPLTQTNILHLDAINLNIEKVNRIQNTSSQKLNFKIEPNSLLIALGQRYKPADTISVAVSYSCVPNAGMYFQEDRNHKGQYFVHTYGEGGLLANWLPIYNDVNDKFSSEMIVTVPEPYTIVSNGKLIEVSKAANGQQRFHWKQTLPHSNYLIAVYAGIFDKGELPSAFGKIPLNYWVPKGRLDEGAYAFRNGTKMVEFFSKRFNYTYPWDKYDQIAIPDYSIGAMEHTSVTGHNASVLRKASDALRFGGPDFNHYHDFWTAEGTISHELAHHWFGDNLTCSNLSYIWLNESFASYSQMLCDEESLGQETLLLDRQAALDAYLEYVNTEHIIRPLEYHYFDTPDDIYNEQHTYLKGAIVLHMLRYVLGDDNFFHALSYYLKKFEFHNVVSNDFKMAIGEATGQNLDWFFDDWVFGGGHPQFDVSYVYLADRKLIDMNVKQIQPIINGQDLFKLPVTITIANSNGIEKHKIWVQNSEEDFLFESATAPLMVSFDGSGNLVAEVKFDKNLNELLYQIKHDALPGQIGALRQITKRFPADNQTVKVLSGILTSDGFWGLKAEAALQLGTLRTPEAWKVLDTALGNPEFRIRKAAVIAVSNFGGTIAAERLKKVINSDSHDDVVATAIVALAKADPNVGTDFISTQLKRPSWYNETTTACMDAFGIIGNKNLVSEIKPFTNYNYNQVVRKAALVAWAKCDPDDPELHKNLIACAEKIPALLQKFAIEKLGDLRVVKAKQVLTKLAKENGDININVLAQLALDEINRVENFKK